MNNCKKKNYNMNEHKFFDLRKWLDSKKIAFVDTIDFHVAQRKFIQNKYIVTKFLFSETFSKENYVMFPTQSHNVFLIQIDIQTHADLLSNVRCFFVLKNKRYCIEDCFISIGESRHVVNKDTLIALVAAFYQNVTICFYVRGDLMPDSFDLKGDFFILDNSERVKLIQQKHIIY